MRKITRPPLTSKRLWLGALLAAGAMAALLAATMTRGNESYPLPQLPEVTHIHGLAVDARDPSRLFLATHHGFFVVSEDGIATRVSAARDDFMGFTPHPGDPSVLYASGHPEAGGNLGFIASPDGGTTWAQLSKGIHGPADFHQMDVSKADPNVIYGAYRGLQVSHDGGRSWRMVGPPPAGLIDLAASARDRDTLYAATESGLLVSRDGGRSWRPAHPQRRPVSLVEVGPGGTVHAFVVGIGLVRAVEPSLDWETVSRGFGERILIHLADDPSDPDRLYAATQRGEVLASRDGGRSWAPFGTK
ncbi:MAG: exo-alpha-sialidase [Proteobacteria bacterium]|nr:exo-alpha-sialidase [Pseudomonadota bacterium]